MNRLLSEKNISVLEYGTDLSFLVHDKNLFSPGEYKMLTNCGAGQLAVCMKTRLNGCTQLIYRTGNLSPLQSAVQEIREEGFAVIACNLLKSICEIEKNGFLSLRNLDASFKHIFINRTTLTARLIYLPLHGGLYRDVLQFEHLFRANLAKTMIDRGFFEGRACSSFLEELQNSRITLHDIASGMKDPDPKNMKMEEERKTQPPGIVKLEASDEKGQVFVMNKEPFLIGRSPEYADAVIAEDRAVGRKHCRLSGNAGQLFIEDLGSVNGTFLNGKRLEANVPVQLKDADMLQIADRTFRLSIGQTDNITSTFTGSGRKNDS